jgi:ArsR family transcriptional regulator, virulence genes transcriptional regulator
MCLFPAHLPFTKHDVTMAKSKSSSESKSPNEALKFIDYTDLRKAVLVLRALNHKLRQKMLDLIEENARMTVTEIYVKLRMEQSVASQHLAILRRAGVVRTERDGKFIFYSLDKERLRQISELAGELAVA